MCSSSPPRTNTQPEQKPLRILLSRDQYDKRSSGGSAPGGPYPTVGSGGSNAAPAVSFGSGRNLFNLGLDPNAGRTPPATPGLNLPT